MKDLGADKAFAVHMAFVGEGPALDAFVMALSRGDLSLYFPNMTIVGWVPVPGDDGGFTPPSILADVPIYADIATLFANKPDISLVVDLSPDAHHISTLRTVAGNEVSIVTSHMLLRLCTIIDAGRLHIHEGNPLRKNQKLFALLVDQIKGDMLIIDENCVILDVNLHASQAANKTVSQIIGLTCKEFAELTDFCICEDSECPYLKARESGKPATRSYSHITAKGRLQYIESGCFPIADALDGSVLYLYIRREVTERRHLEQRLQQTEKMAAIGELSLYVAHEIRNPLFAIGGFANALLRSASLDPSAHEKARIIYDESRRLDVILTNILNFARAPEPNIGEFDVAAIVRQTVNLMTMGGDERGIKTEVDIQPDLPKVIGNAENLKQSLINIIKNAIEAMPQGGTLNVSTKRIEEYVRIDVADTGEGIKSEAHEQIFDPFFSTKRSGSGLGLAMTRKAIEEMGGKIHLESIPDKGTTISLILPVAQITGPGAPSQKTTP